MIGLSVYPYWDIDAKLTSSEDETLERDEDLFLAELNKRRSTSKKKEATGIVFDTTGTY